MQGKEKKNMDSDLQKDDETGTDNEQRVRHVYSTEQLERAASLKNKDVPYTEGRGEFMPVTFRLANGDYLTSVIPTIFVEEAIQNKPSEAFIQWIESHPDKMQQHGRAMTFIVNNLWIRVLFLRSGFAHITVSKM